MRIRISRGSSRGSGCVLEVVVDVVEVVVEVVILVGEVLMIVIVIRRISQPHHHEQIHQFLSVFQFF